MSVNFSFKTQVNNELIRAPLGITSAAFLHIYHIAINFSL